MSAMDRDRFEELKEAYALGALSDAERRDLEEYLDEHPDQRAEVSELQSLANTLALYPAEHEPSAELRRELMSIVESEATEGQTYQRSFWTRLRGFLSLQKLAAGATVVVLIALLSWNALLQGEVRDLESQLQDRQTFAMQALGPAGGAEAEVVKLEGDRSVLVVQNPPSIPSDKTLQIWVVKNGTPQPAGTFQPDDGTVAASINASLENAEAVAVTVEPAGGSDKPTSEHVLETTLQA